MTFKITLDAGHGEGVGSKRGSLIGNEGDNNYAYSLILKKELEKYKDVQVNLTRPKSSDNPTLKERGKMAAGSDILLSLHSNAYNGTAHGFSLFDSVQKPNKTLAVALANSLSKYFRKNRGVYYIRLSEGSARDWYGILRDSMAKSSMMLEHGFHDNSVDILVYVNKRQQLATATAQTLAKHYGLVLKTVKQPAPMPTDKVMIKQGAKYVSLSAKYHNKPVGDAYIGVEYDYERNKVVSKPTWIFIPKLSSYVDESDLVFTKKALKITRIDPKYPHIVLNKDTSLWDFNYDSWDKIKSVKSYKKGTVIGVVDIVVNPLGAKYYRTSYSSEKGILHGFNVVDGDLEWRSM